MNIPYDEAFRPLFLAYIVGLVDLGLEPVVTLGVPGGSTRLDRIVDLILSTRYSVHDLSRVEVSDSPPVTPRFNMPFELGLAVAWTRLRPRRHTFMLFEAVNRRGQKSLSDLAGSDFSIHGGSPKGIMRELCSAFIRETHRPTVPVMMRHYEQLTELLPGILSNNGTENIYEARTFADLVPAARRLSLSH